MARETQPFSLRLEPKLKAAAQAAAAEDRRSLGSLIEVLLAKHCRELELLKEDRK
jgi:hypothetical protein